MKSVTASAAALLMLAIGLPSSAAQAELLDAKCDAFTLEGQFVFGETKRRTVSSLNREWYDSLLRRDTPYFERACSELARSVLTPSRSAMPWNIAKQ